MQNGNPQQVNYAALDMQIRAWAHELGFQAIGISDTDLSAAENGLLEWLALGVHGQEDTRFTRRSKKGCHTNEGTRHAHTPP